MDMVIMERHDLYDGSVGKLDVPIDTPVVLLLNLNDSTFQKNVLKALTYGWRHPMISDYFMKKQLEEPHLFLYHKFNHAFSKKEKEEIVKIRLNEVKFTCNEYDKNKDKCVLTIRLSQKSIEYLKSYTLKHKFKFKNTVEMREIVGEFVIIPIHPKCLMLEIDETKTITGEKESVEIAKAYGSFHSHPYDAYVKYNVCLAWPSTDDFISTLYLFAEGEGFFHIVSTMEGIYVISISEKLMNKDQEEIQKNFKKYEKYINKEYAYDYPTCDPSDKNKKLWDKETKKYIKNVNKKEYFHVQFLYWEDAGKDIVISTKSIKNNCPFTLRQLRFIDLIHNS